MTDIIGTIFVALIGGAVVYITTGPALGATRSRKAVRELLEIQAQLGPGEAAHHDAISGLLEKEVSSLKALGDTRERWFNAVLNAGSALFALAGLTAFSSLFIPSDDLKEVVRYVCGGSLLLTAPLSIIVMTEVRRRLQNRSEKLSTTIMLSFASVASLALAVVSVRDTTYMNQLIESWQNT